MIPYGGLDGMSLLSFWKLSSIKLVVSLDEIEVPKSKLKFFGLRTQDSKTFGGGIFSERIFHSRRSYPLAVNPLAKKGIYR